MTDKRREGFQRRYEKVKPAYVALMKVYPFGLEDLDGEEWLPIPSFEDYLVSDYGRVKSFKNDKVMIRKPSINKTGYLQVNLCKDGKHKMCSVHRLVAELFIPKVGGKEQVNHIDGNKLNNFVGNLEWATSSENVQQFNSTRRRQLSSKVDG